MIGIGLVQDIGPASSSPESDCFVELSRISEEAGAAKIHGWC